MSPCSFSLPIPLAPLVPFVPSSDPLPLIWNPPCCDRIRPPRSLIACKLNSPFPCPCLLTPHSKIPTPWGFSPPNIHSLGRYREPGSQDPAQSWSFWRGEISLIRNRCVDLRFRVCLHHKSLQLSSTILFALYLKSVHVCTEMNIGAAKNTYTRFTVCILTRIGREKLPIFFSFVIFRAYFHQFATFQCIFIRFLKKPLDFVRWCNDEMKSYSYRADSSTTYSL